MARNRDTVKPADSGEEEAEVESRDSDSEPQPEQTKSKTKTKSATQPQPSPMPQNQAPSSSDEEESASETELDSNVRTPASKAVLKTQKSINDTKKVRSKSAATKRPSEDTAARKDVKKAKETENSEKKLNLFQRLWSEDDEIVILKGMIDFSAKNKTNPLSDLSAFHSFIKNSLHMNFSRVQLQDKIRRLKKKYEKNKRKEKQNFANEHEESAYELSDEIWGNETGKENGGEKWANKKSDAAAGESGEVKVVNGGSLEESMLMNGREIYEVGRGVDGEKEWEKLRLEEMELYLKQLELRVAQTKLVLNVFKGPHH